MSTNVLHAPQAIGFGARRLISIAIGLFAVVLIAAVIVLSVSDSNQAGGIGVASGRTFVPSHASDTSAAAPGGGDEADHVPPGSGVSVGRTPYYVPEPNLLPK